MDVRGTVRFWREGKAQHDSSLDIERGAKCAATEGQRAGIRVRRYVEFDLSVREDAKEAQTEEAAAA